VVSAIPPFDRLPEEAAEFNRNIAVLAYLRGWTFTDPWAEQRDGQLWAPGRSMDGGHPVDDGYRLVGAELHAALRELEPAFL
jgi:lysophospholipase L1-like esterase